MNTYTTDHSPLTGNRSGRQGQDAGGVNVQAGGIGIGANAGTLTGMGEKTGNAMGSGAGYVQQGGQSAMDGVSKGANAGKNGASAMGNAAYTGAQSGMTHMQGAGSIGSGYIPLADGSNPFGGDFANVMKLDEAKNIFNANFNQYLTMDFDKFASIIPIDYYGPVTKLLLNFFLFLPGFCTFYTIKMFHDSVFTMIFLSIFVFGMLTFLHYQMIDEKIWYFIALKNFSVDYKARIKSAVIIGLGAGVTLAGALILYFTFVKFGPTEIALQMPYMDNYYDLLYWVFFTIFFVGVLPVCEVLFFVVFQANVWFRASAQIKIAAFYAFYHFGWLCEVVGNWWSILALTAISFVVCLFLIKLMGREDIFKCITVRVGLSLAVWSLLVYLYFQTPKGKTAIPATFHRGSPNNIFMKQ